MKITQPETMSLQGRTIDHFVYAVPDLEASVDWFEEKLGVRPRMGGKHAQEGTQNAILNVGNGCYLEILAIDPGNTAKNADRWMGVDLITKPRLTRWCLKSSALVRDSRTLKKYDPAMGVIQAGSRRTVSGKVLSWEMARPLPTPEVDIVPFMTDWDRSESHPTDDLPEISTLLDVTLKHPDPDRVKTLFIDLSISFSVLEGKRQSISIKLLTPQGILTLE